VIICTQCGRENPDDQEFCANPACGAFLAYPEQGRRVTAPASAPASSNVSAKLRPPVVRVDPGGESVIVLALHNAGTIVDEYAVEVLGEAAAWITVEPPRLPLFPGDEGAVRLRFRPPRSPAAPAGATPFRVRITSKANPAVRAVEEGVVTVEPFLDLSARLVPRTSRGRLSGRHDVCITSGGNAPVRAALSATDPDELLRFRFAPAALTIAPGQTARPRVRAKPRRRSWLGRVESRPFEVSVAPMGAAPVTAAGVMDQLAILPRWLPGTVAVAAVLVAAGLVLQQTVLKPRAPTSSAVPGSSSTAMPATGGSPSSSTSTTTSGAKGGGGGATTGAVAGGESGGSSASSSTSVPAVAIAAIVPAAACAVNSLTTTSANPAQAIPGVAVTVDNGGSARRAVVTLSANIGVDPGAEVRLAYSVDGGAARENVYGPAYLADHQQYYEGRLVTAVIPLAAGAHTVTPFWRVNGPPNASATVMQRCMTVESAAGKVPATAPIVPAAACAFTSLRTASPAPLQAIPGVAVTVDNGTLARNAVVTFSADTGADPGGEVRLAYSVDGASPQENAYGPANLADHQDSSEGRAVTAVIALPAGSHTITPYWRVSGSPGTGGTMQARCTTVRSEAATVAATEPIIPAATCAFDSLSTTWPTPAQAIPGVAVTVDNGTMARRAIVTFSANVGVDPSAQAHLAYSIDGAPPQENTFGPGHLADHQQYDEGRAVSAVIPLPAGVHTITPYWRVTGGPGISAIIAQRCMTVESAAGA
jgi:hypothetical protein